MHGHAIIRKNQRILLFIIVEGLHKEFARAGSDVLQAFTYAANDRLDKVF